MFSDIDERLTVLVQRTSDVNVGVRENPISHIAAGAPNNVRHRPTVDPELHGERVRRLPHPIPSHNL